MDTTEVAALRVGFSALISVAKHMTMSKQTMRSSKGTSRSMESTELGREGRVLPEEAMGMLEAVRTARRLKEPGWCDGKGQGRWQAKKLLGWAAKELATSRRHLKLQYGDIQDWTQREEMERRMGDSLLRWLGLDRPPQQRVRHKVWRKQLTDSTR